MARQTKPLYQRLTDSLVEAIASGKYRVGSTLPTEHQFSSRLGVGRSTVIAALNHLEDMGLVVRRPRHGTRVVSRFPTRSLVTDGGVLQDWARYGSEYYLEVISKDLAPLPPEASRKVHSHGRRKWLRIFGYRLPPRSNSPICVTEIYVNPDYADVRADIPKRPPMIFTLVESRYGPLVRLVEQHLRAVDLPSEAARQLHVREGAAGLQILRWYFGPRDKLIEFTIDTHRADKFIYRMEVRRGSGD